jgi:septum formation protein
MNLNNIDFILASASPRRKELLERAGYKFIIDASGIDENGFDKAHPVEFAAKLALAKANDVANRHRDMLVLGADTIAACDGLIIGKPADAADAERITRLLFSKPHKVITAVAVVRICDGLEISRADTTVVYPKKMTDDMIRKHLASGTWEGKAGAYAIQETGDEFVDRIEGSITNVMGLPMEIIAEIFAGLGIKKS